MRHSGGGGEFANRYTTKGLLAIPMIGITLVGLTVRAHLVYCVGGNLFTVSEFGCCRAPDTVNSIASAVEFVRLFIRIRVSTVVLRNHIFAYVHTYANILYI